MLVVGVRTVLQKLEVTPDHYWQTKIGLLISN